MLITYKKEVTDPAHPIMHGDTPFSREFNKRQKKILTDGKIDSFNFEQIIIVLLEILVDDYNKRHVSRKRKNPVVDSTTSS